MQPRACQVQAREFSPYKWGRGGRAVDVQKLFLSCPLGKGSYGILSSKDKTLLKRPLLCLPAEISDGSGGGVRGHARLALINGSVVVCSSLLFFALGDGLPKQQLFSWSSFHGSCPCGGGCPHCPHGGSCPIMGAVPIVGSVPLWELSPWWELSLWWELCPWWELSPL